MAKDVRRHANPLKIKQGMKLGELDAEADRSLLKECFVDTGLITQLEDVESPTSIILGRTGSGKSALLIQLNERCENSVILDPSDISIRFLEHSNILQFLNELGIKLDLFYRILWRHVLAVELLKLRYDLKDEAQSRSLIQRIYDSVNKDKAREKAFSYFSEWGDRFWLETDEQLKELTEKFERDIRSSIGVSVPNVDVSIEGARSLSSEERIEVTSRASQVVSSIQIKRLNEVLELLEDYAFNDRQKRYYILIDGLDEDWAETDTRYRFIRALIEELKSFRKLSQVKILPAIRRDLLDTVFDKTRDSGFQEEKYESYILRVIWTKEELKKMLALRVNEVYKRQYTREEVKLSDIFSRRKGGGQNPEDYIIERGLLRPRDVLQYANECFIAAANETRVSVKALHTAEVNYSTKRVKSLREEWYDFYPCLEESLEVLRGLNPTFTRSDISGERLESVIFSLHECNHEDPSAIMAKRYLGDAEPKATEADVVTSILQTLYHIGAIGIKLSALDSHIWSHLDQPRISRGDAKRTTNIRIHKMLHRALEINEKPY